KYGGYSTSYLVHLFSDLKRHDMGAGLATPAPQGKIPARVFLTRPLWGLAVTAPYLHDGRAPTVHEAIVLHGGEATKARDAYLALDEPARASVRRRAPASARCAPRSMRSALRPATSVWRSWPTWGNSSSSTSTTFQTGSVGVGRRPLRPDRSVACSTDSSGVRRPSPVPRAT